MSVEFKRDDDFGGTLVIRCDGSRCGNDDAYEGDNFQDAMVNAKLDKWRNIYNQDGTYTNLCPDCGAAPKV